MFCDFTLCIVCLSFLCCVSCLILRGRHSRSIFSFLTCLSIHHISKVDNLVICSLNVRGLLNEVKRRETFNWLRNKEYCFFFLEEVHSSKEMENLWLAEWRYRGLFSSLSSSRAACLTTISLLRFKNTFQIPREDSSQLTS